MGKTFFLSLFEFKKTVNRTLCSARVFSKPDLYQSKNSDVVGPGFDPGRNSIFFVHFSLVLRSFVSELIQFFFRNRRKNIRIINYKIITESGRFPTTTEKKKKKKTVFESTPKQYNFTARYIRRYIRIYTHYTVARV